MLTTMVAAAVAAQLRIAGLQAQVAELDAMRETVEVQRMHIAELEAREPERIEVPVRLPAETAECGMCGAHVAEWWWVASEADGELFEVCRDCYELFRYDMDAR